MLVAALLQNVGNFGFHVAVSQLIGLEKYGAIGALLTLTVALSIPLGALQAAMTRAVAEAGAGARTREVFRRIGWVALVASALVTIFAPIVSEFLHLESVWQAVLLGPYVLVAAAAATTRGAALGRGHAGAAAASVVTTTVARLVIGVPATQMAGLTGALVATIVAEIVGTATVARAASAGIARARAVLLDRRDILETSAVVLGVWLLSSIDLLLARHYLDGAGSALYVAAGTAVRAVLVLPQAVCSVAIVRFVGNATDRRKRQPEAWHALRDALLVTIALSLVGAAGIVIAGPTVLSAFFGIKSGASPELLAWLALGSFPTAVAWTVSMYHLARRSRLALLPWIGAIVEAATVVAWHHNAVTIAQAAVGALLIAGVIASVTAAREHRNALAPVAPPPAPDPHRVNPERLRILVYSWRDLAHSAAGGAEVYMHEILRRWARSGHRVTLFCAAVPGAPSREVVDGYAIVRRGSRFSVYREARKFWDSEGCGRFDLVVDCINTKPFDAMRFVDAPVVALCHQVAREVWWYEAPLPIALVGRFLAEPMWLRRYRDVPTLTVSRSSRDSLTKYGLRQVSVVPEGVDPVSPAMREKCDRPTLVFCGRLVRSKRPHHVLAAFEMVRRHLPDAQLIVIGGGPMEARLRRRAPEGVQIAGRLSSAEKHDLMASAHALAVTSVREGWGLVVSEAAALGTPTVAYDVPGLRDSVAAADGVLTAPRPAALAAGIVDALPSWMAAPPAPRAHGGAMSWGNVASTVLDKVVAVAFGPAAEVSTTASRRSVTPRLQPLTVRGGSR